MKYSQTMDALRNRLNEESTFVDLARAMETPFEIGPDDFAELFSIGHNLRDAPNIEGRVARGLFYAFLRDVEYGSPSPSHYLDELRRFAFDGKEISAMRQNPEILQGLLADAPACKKILDSGLGDVKYIDVLLDKAYEACASCNHVPNGRKEVEWRNIGWNFYIGYQSELIYESDCFKHILIDVIKRLK